jgi:hypothetical protein
LITGIYDGRAPKYYPSPRAERKEKSEKAYSHIMAGIGPSWAVLHNGIGGADFRLFKIHLEIGSRDISQKEHAAAIVGV